MDMTWTSLIGPAVVAAVVSGIVSVVGFFVSARNARLIHAEKLAFDERLAERRTTAEIALAERKFALDQALTVWRRQYDLAEQVLVAAYEARDAFRWARSSGMYSNEGASREATEPEGEKLRKARNLAFVPIERLNAHTKVFLSLQALQDSLSAHLGPGANEPVAVILGVYHSILAISSTLAQATAVDDDRVDREALLPLYDELRGEKAREADRKVDGAIAQLEGICRPILSAKAPE